MNDRKFALLSCTYVKQFFIDLLNDFDFPMYRILLWR